VALSPDQLPAAWDKTVGSASVTIAVIDTGIIKHPDLDSKILPGYDFVSDPTNARDGGGRDGDPTDTSTFEETSFHGSHVAGTVSAASDNTTGVAGVSWNSRVVPVRALGVEGGSTSDIADAILWSAGLPVSGVPVNPNPVQVINMSLGGKGPCPSVYQDAINQATQRGVIVVVAAGNENDDTANYRPASCDNTITVGAVGPQGIRAPYSNYGALIDIMAPGGDLTQRIDFNGKSYAAGVLSTSGGTSGPSYIFINGTSMASPHVAGIVALMKSQNPSLNYTQALAQLKASAKPLDASQCNRPSGADCGPGLVDVAKALGGSGTTPPPPPPPPAQNISTFVVAFYCLNITCLDRNGDLDIDIRKSKAITVKQIQTRTTYSVTNLPPATYLAAGWQDLNDNQEVDDNEPLGVYPGQVFVDPGIRVRNIDIPLVPFKVSQASIAREPGDSSVAREPGDLRRRLREVMQR
jgi:serine protease